MHHKPGYCHNHRDATKFREMSLRDYMGLRRRRRLRGRNRREGNEKSRRRSLRITYPRARGLFKCKHNVVPGRIVPLSVILQFNLRSRGSLSPPTKRGRRDDGRDSLAHSFIVTLLNLCPSIMTISLVPHQTSLSIPEALSRARSPFDSTSSSRVRKHHFFSLSLSISFFSLSLSFGNCTRLADSSHNL